MAVQKMTRVRVVDNSALGNTPYHRPPRCIQVYNKTGVGRIGDKVLLAIGYFPFFYHFPCVLVHETQSLFCYPNGYAERLMEILSLSVVVLCRCEFIQLADLF